MKYYSSRRKNNNKKYKLKTRKLKTRNQTKKRSGGFVASSNLNNIYNTANNSYANLNDSYNGFQNTITPFSNMKNNLNNVYYDPNVRKDLTDLSTHSYNTAKNGSLFGVNAVTGAPISAAYRGYNTYSSAKKGVRSARNVYSSANNAYKSSNNADVYKSSNNADVYKF